jgi:hypothetical protein
VSDLHHSPGVVARDMGSAAVLIHLESNRIFELNSTGARVWALIGEGLGRDAIVAQLGREFSGVEELPETVDDLLEQLRREGLIDG